MSDGTPDVVDELLTDLFTEFGLDDESEEVIDAARANIWHTLALLTTAVPPECTEEEMQNMHRGLRAILMLRNQIRATVMEAHGQPIPSHDEIEDFRGQLTGESVTVH
jgi:hypothetical protein